MANLNQIQAQLRAHIDRTLAARMSDPTGPRLDPELAAVAHAAEIEAQLMHNAAPIPSTT